MYEPDEEHTSFIIDRGLYCYKVMPFGLKNVRATYQRLVNGMFKDQNDRRPHRSSKSDVQHFMKVPDEA